MGYAMEEVSARAARDNMSEILNRVAYQGAHFLLTRHGKGEAVIISITEWKAVEKLLQKLEDEEDIRDAEAVMKRIESGETKIISQKEMKRRLRI